MVLRLLRGPRDDSCRGLAEPLDLALDCFSWHLAALDHRLVQVVEFSSFYDLNDADFRVPFLQGFEDPVLLESCLVVQHSDWSEASFCLGCEVLESFRVEMSVSDARSDLFHQLVLVVLVEFQGNLVPNAVLVLHG